MKALARTVVLGAVLTGVFALAGWLQTVMVVYADFVAGVFFTSLFWGLGVLMAKTLKG
jgi:hypothetical protein